jgi:excisionase family DNA binding protein
MSVRTSFSPAAVSSLHLELDRHALDHIVEAVANRLAVDKTHGHSPWMTTKEAAEYLRCGEARIRKLTMVGSLPREKDGSRNLYNRATLDEFIRNGGGVSP